jgi:hypothetical protein
LLRGEVSELLISLLSLIYTAREKSDLSLFSPPLKKHSAPPSLRKVKVSRFLISFLSFYGERREEFGKF